MQDKDGQNINTFSFFIDRNRRFVRNCLVYRFRLSPSPIPATYPDKLKTLNLVT